MALIPPPIQDVEASFTFKEWLNQLYKYVYSTTGTIPWNSIDKTGSSLVDLQTRQHNQLQAIQGGAGSEYYHLDQTDYDALSADRITKGIDTTDYIIIDQHTDSGLVLKSPDGHYWRVSVGNSGALSTNDLGTSKP